MPSRVIASLQLIIKRIKTSDFVRNVAMVGGGIATGQAIALIFMPFLTRLYSPEAFGVAAAFAAILKIISPITTMGYSNAIVMPESDEDAAAVARLSILCGLTLAPFCAVVVFFGKPWLLEWTGMTSAPQMLYLIPLTLLVGTFLSVANQSAIRAGFFKAKARAYVESKLLTDVSKLVGGLISPSGVLLIVLTIVGQIANLIMQMLRVPRTGVLKIRNWFGTRGVRTAAVLHRDFAIYRMPQSVLNAASVGLPTIMLALLFGASAAGQYSLAVLVLGAPAMLLGQAVGEVFYPKITRAIMAKSPDAYLLLLKVSVVLLAVGIIPFGTVLFFGEYLFTLVFGSEWLVAGSYSQWLSMWLLSNVAMGASVAALPALGLQRFLLIREFFSVVFRVFALYVGFKIYESNVVAIALFSIVGILLSLALICVALDRLFKISREWD